MTRVAADNRYGTTIRWFDRQAGQWRIVWVNPVTGVTSALAGRRDGDRITLIGENQGERFRWSFVDTRPTASSGAATRRTAKANGS